MKPIFPDAWFRPELPSYGTFPWPFMKDNTDYESAARSSQDFIIEALNSGYRHFDTAFSYKNQDQLGTAIKIAGVPRKDLFITSKLSQHDNSYKRAVIKIQEAVELIGGKDSFTPDHYLDSFLIHYPGTGDPAGAWRALQEARESGLVKHIGVSNFEAWHLKKIKKISGEYPEINQIEFHPWIYTEQRDLIEFCHAKGIAVEAYSPLAQGKGMENPLINTMASKYKTTAARIILKWCMQHGVLPVVGSRNVEHIRSNIEQYTFDLSEEDIQAMNKIGQAQSIHIAEQWRWNSKTASFGGPPASRSWTRRLHTFFQRVLR